MEKFSIKSVFIGFLGLAMAVLFAGQASAMTPTITLTSNGAGTIETTVYGDANASVILDYYSGGQLLGAGIVGYTNYSGYFTGTLNSYQYNIPTGAEVIVVVDGQQSAPVTWPANGYNTGTTGTCGYYNGYYSCNNNTGYTTGGQLTLSQSSLSLTMGQSQSVTIYENGNYNNNYYTNGQYYVNNSTNGIVTGTISGDILTVYGQNSGSGSLSVCANDGSGCATLYVTVTNNYNNSCTYPYNYNCGTTTTGYVNGCGYYNGYYSCNNTGYYNNTLSVSNSNVQVTVGNTGVVTLYGNNVAYPTTGYYGYTGYNTGQYYISGNNNGVATATINGNTLTIYGTNPGSTTITVCSSTGGNACASVYVTVIAPIYIYNSPYNYPTQPGTWYYSQTRRCWSNVYND